ncbi:hypothetical protein LMB33_00740 [Limosilactobacillus reuteri]|uniref:hypothetical protein n=1 Tax=Limosilactobacillus reuteri TaxID=1598 RepID=UPI001E294D9E|nr:hypothetical protein [Limosilactobacillus reuteri]MCC4325218.1 hypothetical protein [Limosilactobacillus reuteri]MCC4328937.1 hypothetical protein [Limosilactobacillus reuteri]MCC4352494.1 hypothetical protein [Limosilactobacillus reuteri]MCC4376808.1 hypothetical protein [Limosilactobacillus reuteri]
MSFKKLSAFKQFDNQGFFGPKILMAMSEEPWLDFDSGKKLGTKLNVVVWQDHSDYGDPTITNVGQTLSVKIAGREPQQIITPHLVRLINPEATIYGEYQNQLSVRADDVEDIEGGE